MQSLKMIPFCRLPPPADTNIDAPYRYRCRRSEPMESKADMIDHLKPEPTPGIHLASPTILAALALFIGLAGLAQAQDASNYQIAGSVAAYLGVMPSEIVGGHPPNHPEARMHGGPPENAHSEHIVIALFDDPSGARIEDATVEAKISGMGELGITPIALDAMPIAGVITYGGYVSFPGRDTYTIDLRISRPASTRVTTMQFTYQHGGT